VGAYESTRSPPLIVRREGDRLVGAIRGNDPLALFPLSDHELFAKQEDVRIGFGLDDSGHVRSAAWKQARGGNITFHRMDDAHAHAALDEAAASAKRFKDQTPLPGSEEAARRLTLAFASGKPEYERLSPAFAAFTREALPGIKATLDEFGALKSLTFRSVDPSGADHYDAAFENTLQDLRIRIGANGLIESVGLEPK